MVSPLDPYRTLGLVPGASLPEIKRAYRELAKRYHPDSAGAAALPRFLAVQAAYEALLQWSERRAGQAGPTRRGASGGTVRGESGAGGTTGTWRRDPSWARATREGGRSRAGRRAGAAGGSASAGTTAAGGDTTGARPWPGEGSWSRAARPGAASRQAGGPAGGASARRRRPPNRATFGSTTYDDADEAEPGWDGASWYGQTTGTYWTLNPREYADPRKHGPEYQARARRAADGEMDGETQAGRAAAMGGPTSSTGPAAPGPAAPGPPGANGVRPTGPGGDPARRRAAVTGSAAPTGPGDPAGARPAAPPEGPIARSGRAGES
ncbi:MAG: J domain-containing protein, partial [Candidatus Limnocylindrales bacterium]